MKDFDIMGVIIEDIKRNIDDYSWTFYGVGGFGKSQIVGNLFDDPAFWLWEQGANAIRAKKIPVADWKMAKSHLKTLQKAYKEGKEMPFRTAIMDTADVAWIRCQKYVCEQNGWDDPADGEWGKGHNKVKEEWDLFMGDLEAIGIKVVFISHDKDKEIKPKRGEKYQEIQPSVPAGCQATIYDKVDFCVYCVIEKDGEGKIERKMYFRSNGDFRAKSRLMYMPEVIAYGETPKVAAAEIRKFFAQAVIDEFGEEDGQELVEKKDKPKKNEKSPKKTEKAEEKIEKTEKVEEKVKEVPVEKKVEEKIKIEAPEATQEHGDKTLNELKEILQEKFMALYKSGEKSPVELVEIATQHTGFGKISEIETIEQANKLMAALA